MNAEELRLRYALYLAFFLTLFGYAGRFTGIEPVNNQFFVFAAWSFVLLADNLAYRFKGNSALVSRPGEFLWLAAWSAALCALAELANLRLGAWYYMNQPSDLALRWGGRLLAWAAVLPSVFALEEMLRTTRLFRGLSSRPFTLSPGLPGNLALAGGLLLALAFAMPDPGRLLAMPALFLLAEGLNLRLGLPSLLRELAGGVAGKAARLCASGLLSVLLWNWWNRAAGGGWEYVPPAWLPYSWAPYLAFPLLGPACYSVYSLASWLRAGRTWEEEGWTLPGRAPSAGLRAGAAAFLLIISYIALRMADAHTVRLYLGWI